MLYFKKRGTAMGIHSVSSIQLKKRLTKGVAPLSVATSTSTAKKSATDMSFFPDGTELNKKNRNSVLTFDGFYDFLLKQTRKHGILQSVAGTKTRKMDFYYPNSDGSESVITLHEYLDDVGDRYSPFGANGIIEAGAILLLIQKKTIQTKKPRNQLILYVLPDDIPTIAGNSSPRNITTFGLEYTKNGFDSGTMGTANGRRIYRALLNYWRDNCSSIR
jgi:hypothetical protein